MRSQSKAILVGGLFVLPGLSFLGTMADQNRESHTAQVRRAQAETRFLEQRAATESWERKMRKREWVEQETEKEMQKKFGWIDDLQQQVDEQQQRRNEENKRRMQVFSGNGRRNQGGEQ